uniref:Uncharacterized protein n=1 Tax=Anopheles albimanus TaxID=7167 RepID=A0A182FJB0_ANOAL
MRKKIPPPTISTRNAASSKRSMCRICSAIMTTSNLWRHERTQHSMPSPKKCIICNKAFKNKYSLREHHRMTHENRPAQ